MRYSRHHPLKHIGTEGQERLKNSTVAIVGLGATGSASAELLCRAGVGKLIILDHDVVEESNLPRQLLYSEDDVGKPKAEVASRRLRLINSGCTVEAHPLHLDQSAIDVLGGAGIILDCTDNMRTRLIINDYAKKKGIPWIYSAAVEDRGLVYTTMEGRPCFSCIFRKAESLEDCESIGILNTASTITSSIQVTETLKVLLGETPLEGIVRLNAWNSETEILKVSKDAECPACRGEYIHMRKPKSRYSVEFCRSKAAMSAKPLGGVKLDMEKLRKAFDVKADAGIVAVIRAEGEDIVVHDYGEIVFKGLKDESKIRELADRIYEVAS